MKTIGLIGGMSCESTQEYYRIINKMTNHYLGAHHTAKMHVISVNFNDVVEAMHNSEWDHLASILVDEALKLESSGCELIGLCCNSAHKVASQIQNALTKVPFVHILDAVGKQCQKMGYKKIGLLGNRFTMEDGFYQKFLTLHYNLEVIVPGEKDRKLIHYIIYEELCHGLCKMESQKILSVIVKKLLDNNAEGIILGCTELPLILKSNGCFGCPVLSTTRLHADELVRLAMISNNFTK